MIKELMLDAANSDKLAILEGDDYPVKAGMLRADAQILRRTLSGLIEELISRHAGDLQPGVMFSIKSAQIDLQLTEYLAAPAPETAPAPADRPLGGGYIKDGNTGQIIDTGCPDDSERFYS
jgi:hypothetical protein